MTTEQGTMFPEKNETPTPTAIGDVRSMLINAGKDFEKSYPGSGRQGESVEEMVDRMMISGALKNAGSGLAVSPDDLDQDNKGTPDTNIIPAQYEIQISKLADASVRLFEPPHEHGFEHGSEVTIAPNNIVEFCRRVLLVAGFQDVAITALGDDLHDGERPYTRTMPATPAANSPPAVQVNFQQPITIEQEEPEDEDEDAALRPDTLAVGSKMAIWVYRKNGRILITQDQMLLYGDKVTIQIDQEDATAIADAVKYAGELKEDD